MSLSIRPAVTAWSDAQLLIMVCIVALRHEHVILYEFTWLIPYHDIDLISNIRSNPSRRQQCWESRIHDTHLVHRFENYCKELSTVELSCRLLIVGTMQQMALIAILIRSSPLHPPSLSNLHISFPLSLSLSIPFLSTSGYQTTNWNISTPSLPDFMHMVVIESRNQENLEIISKWTCKNKD